MTVSRQQHGFARLARQQRDFSSKAVSIDEASPLSCTTFVAPPAADDDSAQLLLLLTSRATLLQLTCVYACYGLIVGTMALEVLPAEASRLHPGNESAMLGALLATVGVSQLACPAAGQLSDKRSGGVWHRRGVLMLACSLMAAASVGAMAFASILRRPLLYVLSLFIAMTALNVVHSVQTGIVPDLIPPEVQGSASVMVALNSLGGAIFGFFLTWLAAKWDLRLLYPLYAALLLLAVIVELLAAGRLETAAISAATPSLTVSAREQTAAEKPLAAPTAAMAATAATAATAAAETAASTRSSSPEPASPAVSAMLPQDLLLLPSEIQNESLLDVDPPAAEALVDEVPMEEALMNESPILVATLIPENFSVFLDEGSSTMGEEEGESSCGSCSGCCSLDMSQREDSSGRLPAQLRLPETDESSARFWKSVWEVYTADLQRDFFLVFVGRACYYCSVSCQVFMLYFIRDLMNVSSVEEQKSRVAMLALLAQIMAALTAYPLGRWTQRRAGVRTYQRVLTGACAVMAAAYGCFLLVPIVNGGVNGMLFSAMLYGGANGCFLSADYALALCTLPDRKFAARALGLWGVSGFIGATIGPFAGGIILHHLGSTGKFASTGEELYSWSGYAGLIGAGAAMSAVSAACVLSISPEGKQRTHVSEPY